MKVATIFELAGACRRDELTKLSLHDIEDKENVLIIRIFDSKNHLSRNFVIPDQVNNGTYLTLCRKYRILRPLNTPHRRLLVYYKKGKCTVQWAGVNTFGKMPSEIAAYLGLQNPQLYTGHNCRYFLAAISANAGDGIILRD